jgi:hypothetical protein
LKKQDFYGKPLGTFPKSCLARRGYGSVAKRRILGKKAQMFDGAIARLRFGGKPRKEHEGRAINRSHGGFSSQPTRRAT